MIWMKCLMYALECKKILGAAKVLITSVTVVVLLCGAPVECPWADQVKGILYMGLPGQTGGEAIADLLYGRANPSGKLAETWPLRYEDCISSTYYGKTKDAPHSQSSLEKE